MARRSYAVGETPIIVVKTSGTDFNPQAADSVTLNIVVGDTEVLADTAMEDQGEGVYAYSWATDGLEPGTYIARAWAARGTDRALAKTTIVLEEA